MNHPVQHLPKKIAYMTTKQAADVLGVSPKTVSRHIKEGRVPHIRTLGGHARIPTDWVIARAEQKEATI